MDKLTRRGALAGGGAAAIVAAMGTPSIARTNKEDQTIVVTTAEGKLRGRVENGVSVFKAVPYGASTADANRFMAPKPVVPWTGVRDAFSLPPVAPQGVIPNQTGGWPPELKLLIEVFPQEAEEAQSEDCLHLNIWTPSTEGDRRPVLVWLHGGGFFMGSGNTPVYDGRNLSEYGDVVVVTVNHRLSAPGFLHLADLPGSRFPDSGNAGLLDIVQALQWVRDNIASFGGDPGCVTIFGQSGGGVKVSCLLAMPAAKGLFHRAVVQSGPGISVQTPERATSDAERILRHLGMTPGQVNDLPKVPLAKLMLAARTAPPNSGERPRPFGAPVLDGRNLPAHPFEPAAPAQSADIPLMIGWTSDELSMLLAADPLYGDLTLDVFTGRAMPSLDTERGTVAMQLYQQSYPGMLPEQLMVKIASDRSFLANSLRLAERKLAQNAAPVFVYQFDYASPAFGGTLGSPHCQETPFIFRNLKEGAPMIGTGAGVERLAGTVSGAWLRFARTGDPSSEGLPWSAYDTKRRPTMLFDKESKAVDDPHSSVRQFWT